jgi:hypothetical protein
MRLGDGTELLVAPPHPVPIRPTSKMAVVAIALVFIIDSIPF